VEAGAVALLRRAISAGLSVGIESDDLVVRGPKRLEALARELLADEPAVIAALRAELAARVLAMQANRDAAVAAGRPLPFLVARPSPALPGYCLSCGSSVPTYRIRCCPCAHAARIVVNGHLRGAGR
jgi:hypothetical protein